MEKLYMNKPYVKDFTACVMSIRKKDGKTEAVLDSTYFYPEGGGQPSDTGSIGGSRVTYVYEEDDIIYHVLDKDLEPSIDVECHIDWDRRFDHMQQHCGQHILSAAFEEVLKAPTVSFHLGEEYVSIDIAAENLPEEKAREVEELSNNIIFQNLPVKVYYPEPHEIKDLKLRKPPAVTEDIRIVEVEGFDCSACCGTHPERTGDVGIIKIRKWEKYKDGFRVEFLCGKRALQDYVWKNSYINEISFLLSSRDRDVLENVKKSIDELHSTTKEIKQLKEKVLSYEAVELLNNAESLKGVKIVREVFTDRDFKEVTNLAGKIARNDSTIALLGLKSDTARMVFTRSADVNIKINELFREVVSLINGKGGGNPQSAQGGGSDVTNLQSAIDSAYLILKNRHLK